MRWSAVLAVFVMCVGHVQVVVGKLTPEQFPKSSEVLSNHFYNNNFFDNDITASYKRDRQQDDMHVVENGLGVDDENAVIRKATTTTGATNGKQTSISMNRNGNGGYGGNGGATVTAVFVDGKDRKGFASDGRAIVGKQSNKAATRVAIYYIKTAPPPSPQATPPLPPFPLSPPPAYMTIEPQTRTGPSTGTAAARPPTNNELQLTPYSSAVTKIYGMDGFYNPFGQLGAFFGGDQLNLQDYNILFNAERHTVFHLHTTEPTDAQRQAALKGNVLNVVSGSIGAVFGAGPALVSSSVPPAKVEEVQLYNAASLRQSRFNPFNPTRILIHGWLGGAHANVYNTLVPEYLKVGAGAYNIFTVDWGRGAIADYITASYRVKPVGRVVAKFVDFLQREANLRLADVHVIGFSMGAHVAGIAGKHLTTGHLPVIYALDPALPLFRYDKPDERLTTNDADYVEVLHSSAGSYGYDRPLGHVDFYLNWGSGQPGCFLNECSHFRAFQVFAESLTGDVLRGQGCMLELWQDLVKNRRCLMASGLSRTLGGDPLNGTVLRQQHSDGVYYLTTNASPPYAKAGNSL